MAHQICPVLSPTQSISTLMSPILPTTPMTVPTASLWPHAVGIGLAGCQVSSAGCRPLEQLQRWLLVQYEGRPQICQSSTQLGLGVGCKALCHHILHGRFNRTPYPERRYIHQWVFLKNFSAHDLYCPLYQDPQWQYLDSILVKTSGQIDHDKIWCILLVEDAKTLD